MVPPMIRIPFIQHSAMRNLLVGRGFFIKYNDISSYRRLIGWVLYLTTTRPGITIATHKLSQFLSYPTQVHFHTACRVLHYLKICPGRSLSFVRISHYNYVVLVMQITWANFQRTRREVEFELSLLHNIMSLQDSKQKTFEKKTSN